MKGPSENRASHRARRAHEPGGDIIKIDSSVGSGGDGGRSRNRCQFEAFDRPRFIHHLPSLSTLFIDPAPATRFPTRCRVIKRSTVAGNDRGCLAITAGFGAFYHSQGRQGTSQTVDRRSSDSFRCLFRRARVFNFWDRFLGGAAQIASLMGDDGTTNNQKKEKW